MSALRTIYDWEIRGDFMRKKKGQAAMEFLMTYGWAILVVLAAIGALAYFGVLNPGNWLPSKCTIHDGFTCQESKVYNNGTDTVVYLKVRNNLGFDADINDIRLNSSTCTLSPANDDNGASGWSVLNDETAETNGVIQCTSPQNIGDRFKAKIRVIYNKAGETINHTASGDMSKKVEEQ